LSAQRFIVTALTKGFWSEDNHSTLQQAAIEEVILPKRGRHNKEDKKRENTPTSKKLRNAHSAVQSNINMLEHHGLNRCMDKGLRGYKRMCGIKCFSLQPAYTLKCTQSKRSGKRSQKRKTTF
jgi:hypothetical protein